MSLQRVLEVFDLLFPLKRRIKRERDVLPHLARFMGVVIVAVVGFVAALGIVLGTGVPDLGHLGHLARRLCRPE